MQFVSALLASRSMKPDAEKKKATKNVSCTVFLNSQHGGGVFVLHVSIDMSLAVLLLYQ